MNCSGGQFQVAQLASVGGDAVLSLNFDPSAQSTIGAGSSTDVSFKVESNNKNYRLKCYVNSVQTSTCSSPISLATQPDGDQSVTVVAENLNGLMLTQINRTFRIDRKAPVLTVTAPPAAQIGTTSTSVQFTVTDNLSAAAEITVQCLIDTETYTSCSSPKPYSNLKPGSHTIKMKATDLAGNTSPETSISFSVVLGVPTVAISQKPAAFINVDSATFVFAGTSSSTTISGYECSIDNGQTFSACTSPMTYNALKNQPYDFAVRAVDSFGSKSAPSTAHFTVDTAAPSTPSVTSNLMSPSKQTALSLSFSSSDSSGIASYQCSMDGGAYATCTSPKPFSGLTSRSHTFNVKSVDQAGNSSLEGTYTIVIDLDAPTLTITSTPSNPTTATAATFNFTYADALSGINLVECQLDTESAYSNCTSPKPYPSVMVGARIFNVRATDKAGNSIVKTYAWTISAAATPTPTPVPTPVPTPTPTPPPTSGNNSPGCGKPVNATGFINNIPITAGGKNRTYNVRLPANYNPNEALPIFFDYHGAADFAKSSATAGDAGDPALDPKAEKAIYVYTQGLIPPGSGVTGWDLACSGYDVPAFNAILSTVSNNYCINTNRIFVTGGSWGGAMAQAVACCSGNKIRAMMSAMAAGLPETPNQCVSPAPAFRAYMGSDDPNCPVADFKAMLGKFAELSKCTSGPIIEQGKGCDGLFYEGALCTRHSYTGCQNEVSGTVVGGLGHSFPYQYLTMYWNYFSSYK